MSGFHQDVGSDVVRLAPVPARRHVGGGNARTVAGIVVAVVLGIVVRHVGHHGADVAVRELGRPTPGVGEQASRVLPAPPLDATPGGYAFLETQPDGEPVTWDPCRPIHYVVAGTPPPGGERLVEDAVARVGAASGLSFVSDGQTTETAVFERAAYQPKLYGDRWAPLLVAWTDDAREPSLAGDVIGRGGSIPVTGRDHRRTYVTGALALDAPQFATNLGPTSPSGIRMRAVVVHELGHVLGLGHVQDPGELMYPESQVTSLRFGPGDRRGFARAGLGACAPDL